MYFGEMCNDEDPEHHLTLTEQQFDIQQTGSLLGSIAVKSVKGRNR